MKHCFFKREKWFIWLMMLMFSLVSVKAQNLTITGTVSDETGDMLPGVNVLVKGMSISVVTGADGRYSINVPNDDMTLVFSFIGYATQEIVVGSQRTINVTLREDVRAIEEVVVVGYGTIRKKDVTGSVSNVKSEDLMQRPATSLTQSIAGRMSGVSVSTNSGRPGGNQIIRIRGYSSIQATNEPLYIIDGVPGDLNSLNPKENT